MTKNLNLSIEMCSECPYLIPCFSDSTEFKTWLCGLLDGVNRVPDIEKVAEFCPLEDIKAGKE